VVSLAQRAVSRGGRVLIPLRADHAALDAVMGALSRAAAATGTAPAMHLVGVGARRMMSLRTVLNEWCEVRSQTPWVAHPALTPALSHTLRHPCVVIAAPGVAREIVRGCVFGQRDAVVMLDMPHCEPAGPPAAQPAAMGVPADIGAFVAGGAVPVHTFALDPRLRATELAGIAAGAPVIVVGGPTGTTFTLTAPATDRAVAARVNRALAASSELRLVYPASSRYVFIIIIIIFFLSINFSFIFEFLPQSPHTLGYSHATNRITSYPFFTSIGPPRAIPAGADAIGVARLQGTLDLCAPGGPLLDPAQATGKKRERPLYFGTPDPEAVVQYLRSAGVIDATLSSAKVRI
jgi:hypothetical protein